MEGPAEALNGWKRNTIMVESLGACKFCGSFCADAHAGHRPKLPQYLKGTTTGQDELSPDGF